MVAGAVLVELVELVELVVSNWIGPPPMTTEEDERPGRALRSKERYTVCGSAVLDVEVEVEVVVVGLFGIGGGTFGFVTVAMAVVDVVVLLKVLVELSGTLLAPSSRGTKTYRGSYRPRIAIVIC